jgi:uncharacterized metal-binding protein YceD (DUF177 family)
MARTRDSLPPDPAAVPDAPRAFSHPLRVAQLPARKPLRFDLAPDAPARAALAAELGLIQLPKLRLKGQIMADGSRDFVLTARLEAEIVQPCIITLAPVPSRIAEDVTRRYVRDWQEPEADEVEMPEDDSIEPLPDVIDLGDVLAEALSLALPLYPRAEGAELGAVDHAPPGADPITDADLKPFAGLAALKQRLEGGDS